jgi:hypothetical protein
VFNLQIKLILKAERNLVSVGFHGGPYHSTWLRKVCKWTLPKWSEILQMTNSNIGTLTQLLKRIGVNPL